MNQKLSIDQMKFIENNYLALTAKELSEELNVSKWCIHDYKRKKRLIKQKQGKSGVSQGKYFNVHAQNWI